MNDNFDEQYARQLRQTDQKIRLDAEALTESLRDRRQKLRQKHSNRIRAAYVLSVCCILCVLGIQYGLPGWFSETELASPAPPVPVASEVKEPGIAIGESNFEFAFLEKQTELDQLRRQLRALKKTSHTQQLTIAKENISRSLFDNSLNLPLLQ